MKYWKSWQYDKIYYLLLFMDTYKLMYLYSQEEPATTELQNNEEEAETQVLEWGLYNVMQYSNSN